MVTKYLRMIFVLGFSFLILFLFLHMAVSTQAQGARMSADFDRVIQDPQLLGSEIAAGFVAQQLNVESRLANAPMAPDADADLEINVLADPEPVIAGTPITYTVVITNHGPSAATSVQVINDFPPAYLIYNGSIPGICGVMGHIVTCQLGDLETGLSTQFDLLMTVKSGATDPMQNTIAVSSGDTDPNPGNNTQIVTTTIDYSSDLWVTKSDDPDPVDPGGTLTYTLTITNSGPSDADGVIVTDTLPAELSLLTSSCEGLVCALGTIITGGTATVTLVTEVDIAASGVITNSVEVSGLGDDPEPLNDFYEEHTTIGLGADLSITKSAFPDPIAPGGLLTYTLNVVNNGPDPAPGVTIIDTLPGEMTFVSSEPSSPICSEVGGVVTCGTWSLGPGGSTAVNIIVEVDPMAVGLIDNRAQVSSDAYDPDTSNDQVTQTITILDSADLGVSTIHDPEPAEPGGTLTYTLTVTNNGPFDATGVILTDTLPAEVSFVEAIPTQGSCVGTICSLDTISVGESAEVTLVGSIDLEALGVITNTAMVSSDLVDAIPDNNLDREFTTVGPGADLTLVKTASADPVIAGEVLTYSLTIQNTGSMDAHAVELIDTLPSEVTFISLSPGGSDCNHTGGIVSCSLGDLLSSESVLVEITVLVDPSVIGDLTNQAYVSSYTFDPDLESNQAEVTTLLETSADLSLKISDDPDPVIPGNELTYTIDLDNNGLSVSRDVTMTIQLPVDANLVSITPGSPTCIQVQAIVTCSLSELPDQAGIEVFLNMLVDGDANGTLTLHASLSSGTPDPVEANNTASEETTVMSPDTIPPVVEWIYPVGDEQSLDVGTQVLPLEVNASDNVGIQRVDFFWWDPVIEQFLDIGSVFVPPYRVDFDTAVLYYGYNQVYVRGYDTSGNASNRPRILLFRIEMEHQQYLPVISR